MEKLGKIVLLALLFGSTAIVVSSFANKPVQATSPVGNMPPGPLYVQDIDNAGLHPFAVSASCTSSNDTGCAANPVLPLTTATGGAVRTVVIDFMSAVCTGLAPGISQDNFNFGYPLGGQSQEIFFPAIVDLAGTGRIGLQTTIYADPGVTTSFGTPGVNSGCSVSVTGHLIPQ